MHTNSVDEHFNAQNAWTNLWGAPVIWYVITYESVILCGEIPIY